MELYGGSGGYRNFAGKRRGRKAMYPPRLASSSQMRTMNYIRVLYRKRRLIEKNAEANRRGGPTPLLPFNLPLKGGPENNLPS